MIKSEREHRTTLKAIKSFEDGLRAHDAAGRDADETICTRAARASMEAQLQDLRTDVEAWAQLQAGNMPTGASEKLEHLPRLLTAVRIARGLSREKLAEKLSEAWRRPLGARQIRRWEEDDYQHVAFWQILEVADALDLEVHVRL